MNNEFKINFISNNYMDAKIHFNRYKCIKFVCINCFSQYIIKKKNEIIYDESTIICNKCKVKSIIPIIPKNNILYNLNEEDINNKLIYWRKNYYK